ncbi:MAG: hypothetical protein IKF52_06535 [Clostridia bacterium]|nr:hypothetical protein [Clostridia bacterium]
MTNEFAFASGEINEIFKYLSPDQVNKIPIKLRKFFEDAEIENYVPHIDHQKRITEQDISEKTKSILAVLYRKYWSDVNIRGEIDAKLLENERRYQEELRNRYNPDNIFENRKVIAEEKEEIEEPKSIMIIEEKKSIFSRIINKIKCFFKH